MPDLDDVGKLGTDSDVAVTRIARVGDMATSLASTGAGDTYFIGRRSGQILRLRVLSEGQTSVPSLDSDPALDLSALTTTEGERGLFDLVVSNDDRTLFVSYSALDGAVTVDAFRLDADGSIEPNPRRLFSLDHPFAGHNGGGLVLLPSGDLLLSLGDMDLEDSNNPPSQDTRNPMGGIVRLSADSLRGDDDLAGTEAAEIVAKGLRNPWRISFDGITESLWIGDVGEHTDEEINIATTLDSADPVNFGWPAYEGFELYDESVTSDSTFEKPVIVRKHSDDVCSTSGGVMYRGRQIPQLYGAFVSGDLCSKELRATIVVDGAIIADRVIVELPNTVVSITEDAAGEVFALDVSGDVWRLDPPSWNPPDVSEEGFSGPSTTTPSSDEADCGAVHAILALQPLNAIPPAELEEGMVQVLAELRQAEGTTANSGAVSVLQATFERLLVLGEASDWEVDRDPLKAALDDLLSGSGEFTEFPEAVNTLLGSAESCLGPSGS